MNKKDLSITDAMSILNLISMKDFGIINDSLDNLEGSGIGYSEGVMLNGKIGAYGVFLQFQSHEYKFQIQTLRYGGVFFRCGRIEHGERKWTQFTRLVEAV